MDLVLRLDGSRTYRSLSQLARILTESWLERNMYCLACDSDVLCPERPGKPVLDFTCPKCGERYQLKSQKKPFGGTIANSAYENKVNAIRTGTNPSYLFLQYDFRSRRVVNLFAVPKDFISESAVKKRSPLRISARRAGWVGSTILLRNLPQDARIYVIRDGHIIPEAVVRHMWERFFFMRDKSVESRGWLVDVLSCVRRVRKETFSLADLYAFEEELRDLHPGNRNIRPKIRQQLQVLRDKGIIDFKGHGVYSALVSAKLSR